MQLLTVDVEEGTPHLKQLEPYYPFTASDEKVSRRRVLAAGVSVLASSGAVRAQITGQLPKSNDALHYSGLLELASKFRKRELSPVEITKAQLARIALLEPQLMAFDTITADVAIEQAKIAES